MNELLEKNNDEIIVGIQGGMSAKAGINLLNNVLNSLTTDGDKHANVNFDFYVLLFFFSGVLNSN